MGKRTEFELLSVVSAVPDTLKDLSMNRTRLIWALLAILK